MVEYKLIDGFPGYRVGDDGSVWSNKRGGEWVRLKGRIIKGSKGYVEVCLCNNGVRVHRLVQRLVAFAFLGPPPEPEPEMEAAHLNGQAGDNRAVNLKWKLPVDNTADKELHGTQLKGTKHPLAKLTEEDVRELVVRCNDGETQGDLAAELNVSRSTVGSAVRGDSYKDVRRTPGPVPVTAV